MDTKRKLLLFLLITCVVASASYLYIYIYLQSHMFKVVTISENDPNYSVIESPNFDDAKKDLVNLTCIERALKLNKALKKVEKQLSLLTSKKMIIG